MRIAELCPNCATYIDATCIIYNGDNLSTIDAAPLTSLDEILSNINDTFTASSGTGLPTSNPKFVGQLYIDTLNLDLYIGLDIDSSNWGLIGEISTTTTTTTT